MGTRGLSACRDFSFCFETQQRIICSAVQQTSLRMARCVCTLQNYLRLVPFCFVHLQLALSRISRSAHQDAVI